MARGDFDWAWHELENDLGPAWRDDEFGALLLHMGLYENENTGHRLAPDLQHGAYEGFIDYMQTHYEYDFEDEFDWEAYREWYE